MFERIFLPLAPYLFMTTGLIACIYLFCSLKQEIRQLRNRLQDREQQLDATAAAMKAEIADMRADLKDAEERTAQLVPPAPARSGLNVTSRTQVLRMFRHGEAEENIATKLGLPRNEVSLVLKVHQLAVDGAPFMTVQ